MEATLNVNELLQLELKKRQEKNHQYSLRAFARGLEISPSYLCEILQNRKRPTTRMKKKIISRLEAINASTSPVEISVMMLDNNIGAKGPF